MPLILSPDRPFVLGVNSQAMGFCGVGVCDATLARLSNALAPFVYDTVLHEWSMVETPGEETPTPANTAGDDLFIESGQTRTLFTAGVGETDEAGSGLWWAKTLSDTSLYQKGDPAGRPYMFMATGMAVHVGDPFQRGDEGDAATDPKFYTAFLQSTESGPTYGFLIQKFHMNYNYFTLRVGDTGQTYRVGLAAHYPEWGGPAGSCTDRNGLTSVPGTYLPFNAAFCFGNRDDINQVSFASVTGQAGRIQSQSGDGGTNLPPENADGTVYAPLRVDVIGYIICVPAVDQCGVLTPAEVAAQRAAMGLPPG